MEHIHSDYPWVHNYRLECSPHILDAEDSCNDHNFHNILAENECTKLTLHRQAPTIDYGFPMLCSSVCVQTCTCQLCLWGQPQLFSSSAQSSGSKGRLYILKSLFTIEHTNMTVTYQRWPVHGLGFPNSTHSKQKGLRHKSD